MRHFDILIPQRWLISEAKARIDHPEDLVFDEGSAGAQRALSAMVQAAEKPHTVTIKWDGSPALIFGRDDEGFVLTDKSGFSSKKGLGMPRSAADVKNMLFMRKPNDPGRDEYSSAIASLYNLLNQAIPLDFRGYLMGDVLWTSTPRLQNGNYVFTPNKVTYSIPSTSAVGKQVGDSRAGMVVHSIFHGRDDEDSRAIGDINGLGLIGVPGLLLMGPEIKDLEKTNVSPTLINKMRTAIKQASPSIDSFLNRQELMDRQITDLPALMKRFVAHEAGTGRSGLSHAPIDFVKWLNSDASKLSDRKRKNVQDWISQHLKGYNATWMIADKLIDLKDYIRHDVDRQVGTNIGATLRDKSGHEGYVADTPSGKIKFVNRPHFMKKD